MDDCNSSPAFQRLDDKLNTHIGDCLSCKANKLSEQENTRLRLDSQHMEQLSLHNRSESNRELIKNLESEDGRTQDHLKNTDKSVESMKTLIEEISDSVDEYNKANLLEFREQGKRITGLAIKNAFASGGLALAVFLIELYFNSGKH